ncbi:alpha/beta fold hydrolase [Protaetiibacter mangrovi]|uniref:Alpha/beta hydrolase n=1 Tax=Protaetiibacter mangrovi TaxID=2970926 RepID=A0ABT1ZBG3_9MICO|nr:alpha/beta hydrolase [Protaetiibacter mangrovi]MCS0498024.1 alpha/beta hydrolase [Protaetiibacter mangrovi]
MTAPLPDPAADATEAVRLDAEIGEIDWTRPAPGSTRSVFEAPSGPLAVVSLGDPRDPRVVLVPGATGSKEDFVLMLPLLAAAGFHVQSYDLAGNYESAAAGPADGGRYDYPLFTADLLAFLRAGAPAHLLGYSFAGIVAQLVAAEHPELVRSLTLLTTPPDPGNAYRHVKRIGWLSRFLSGRQGAGLMIWGIRTNKNRVGPSRLAFVRARFASTRRACIDDIVHLMKNAPDAAAAVRAAGIPVLVATSEHDLWPVRRYALHAERLDARLAVYRTGHSPCETTPHQLVHDMLRLFRDVG